MSESDPSGAPDVDTEVGLGGAGEENTHSGKTGNILTMLKFERLFSSEVSFPAMLYAKEEYFLDNPLQFQSYNNQPVRLK